MTGPSDQPDHLRAHAVEFADEQMARKAQKFILFQPLLAILLLIIGPHDSDDLIFVIGYWVLALITTVVRIWLHRDFKAQYAKRQRMWRYLFYGSSLLNAAGWGVITHVELSTHGLALPAQFCIIAMAAMIIIFNGSVGHLFRVSLLCNLFLTLPLVFYWVSASDNLVAIVISTLAYAFFLVSQALERKREFWERVGNSLNLQQHIEEIERVNRELQQTSAEAVAAASSKTRFIANTSHELRTPLHGILGNAELLLQSNLNARSREYAEAIHGSGKSLLRLVDDILDLARVESGQLKLDISPFSVDGLLKELSDTLRRLAVIKNLDFEMGKDPNVPDWLSSDRERLRQVLINLGGNAIKFTDSGFVRIWVKYHEDSHPNQLEVFVSDSGPGIPDDQQKVIFDDFVQVDSSNSRQHSGTGLGLSICRSLISVMKGKIGVESLVGIGTTFWVSVPVDPAQPPQEITVVGPRFDSDKVQVATRKRILIVDDNQVNRDLLGSQLESLEHLPTGAAGGEEALTLCKGIDFDLIFMDCQMPGMDGYEATRRIRAMEGSDSRIPIVAVTANAMPEERDRCIQCGMDDYVSKPLDLKILRNLLATWLGRSEPVDPEIEELAAEPAGQLTSDDVGFDQKRVQELRNLSLKMGKELLVSVFESFDGESRSKLQELQQSKDQQDYDGASKHAHALKGMCLDLGLSELANQFDRIETEPTSADQLDFSELAGMIRDHRAALADKVGVKG